MTFYKYHAAEKGAMLTRSSAATATMTTARQVIRGQRGLLSYSIFLPSSQFWKGP
jgi:hypothetical protein